MGQVPFIFTDGPSLKADVDALLLNPNTALPQLALALIVVSGRRQAELFDHENTFTPIRGEEGVVRMAYDTKCKTKRVKVNLLWCTVPHFLSVLGRVRTHIMTCNMTAFGGAVNDSIDNVPAIAAVRDTIRDVMEERDINKKLTAHGMRAIYCAMMYEEYFEGKARAQRPIYDQFSTDVLGHSTDPASSYYNKLLDSRSQTQGMGGDTGADAANATLHARIAELEEQLAAAHTITSS